MTTAQHATTAQLTFLNKLLDEAQDLLRERDSLDGLDRADDVYNQYVFPMRPDASTYKTEASQDIDTAMANNKVLRDEIKALRAAAGPVDEAPAEFVTEGMYNLNGRIYKVLPSRSGNGRHYAQELVGESETGYKFQYAKGAMYRLRAEHRMTLEQELEWGKLHGHCIDCGILLTHPKSVDYGKGPVCSDNYTR